MNTLRHIINYYCINEIRQGISLIINVLMNTLRHIINYYYIDEIRQGISLIIIVLMKCIMNHE